MISFLTGKLRKKLFWTNKKFDFFFDCSNQEKFEDFVWWFDLITGKSFSEALIIASTNPQYDKRLLIELPVQYMKISRSEQVENMMYTQIVFVLTFRTIYVHNMFSACSELGIFMYNVIQ